MAKKNRPDWLRDFYPAETVTEAFHVGRIQGECGYARLSRAQFFANEDESRFGFPSSLYRAYRKGHQIGREARARRRARREVNHERGSE